MPVAKAVATEAAGAQRTSAEHGEDAVAGGHAEVEAGAEKAEATTGAIGSGQGADGLAPPRHRDLGLRPPHS